MININGFNLKLGSRLLFEDASLTIFDKQKVGLVGPNGCGKSTLFKLLLGELQPDGGEVNIPRQMRISHLSQETPPLSISALDFVVQGDKILWKTQNDLTLAESKNDFSRLADLHQKIADLDGYTAVARAGKLLDGLGFSNDDQQKAVKNFSGGWRTRLNLAQTLMCPADLLLLDEPTNHLDLDAILWLEKWLQKFSGTLLIVSHDRIFLDNCVDHIIEVNQHQLKSYSGNYSDYEKLRALQLALQQKTYEKQQKKIAHMMEFVNRFKAKASKAKQAQSRLTAIQKMDVVTAVQAESAFNFEFREIKPPPNPLLTLTDAEVKYNSNHIIFNKINFQIYPGMRAALLGPNGAGKSTFIKMIAKQISLSKGLHYMADGVRLGYYAQHQIEQLNYNQSPLWHLQQQDPQASSNQLRNFLGSFGFSGEMALSSIEKFSGGEKARLALSLLVWEAPNLLLLDEPTNHLDLEMRNALTLALQSYSGALILVSHDRYLLQTTADEFFLVANHQLQPFAGDLLDYQKWLFSQKESEKPTQNIKSKPNKYKLQDQINKLEKSIQKLQIEKDNLEQQLADSNLYKKENLKKLEDLVQKQKSINGKLQQAEQEWLELSQEFE